MFLLCPSVAQPPELPAGRPKIQNIGDGHFRAERHRRDPRSTEATTYFVGLKQPRRDPVAPPLLRMVTTWGHDLSPRYERAPAHTTGLQNPGPILYPCRTGFCRVRGLEKTGGPGYPYSVCGVLGVQKRRREWHFSFAFSETLPPFFGVKFKNSKID